MYWVTILCNVGEKDCVIMQIGQKIYQKEWSLQEDKYFGMETKVVYGFMQSKGKIWTSFFSQLQVT